MPLPAATFLFAPAHEARKVAGALASGADAAILDIEDSVPPGRKTEARAAVAAALAQRGEGAAEAWVRVNAAGPDFDADVAEVPLADAAGVVLPKAEEPARVAALAAAGARRALLLIESAAGL